MSSFVCVIRIPIDESLNINSRLVNGAANRTHRHRVDIAHGIWPAISSRLPVAIDLRMDSMQAAGRVGGLADTVTRRENVESRIAEAARAGKCASSIYRVKIG